MENKVEWGVITRDSKSSLFKKGDLVRLFRNPKNKLVIWEVESEKGYIAPAFVVYYDPIEIESEEKKDMYRMLYPNWAELF